MKTITRAVSLSMAILLSLTLAGCGQSAKSKLVGQWQGGVEFDDAAVQQRLEQSGNNPIAKAIAQKAIEAFESGSLSITLKADDTYTSSTQLGPFSKEDYGTWEVVEEQPTEATIRFTSHEGNVQEATVRFSDKDVITSPFQGQGAGLGVFRCTRVPSGT